MFVAFLVGASMAGPACAMESVALFFSEWTIAAVHETAEIPANTVLSRNLSVAEPSGLCMYLFWGAVPACVVLILVACHFVRILKSENKRLRKRIENQSLEMNRLRFKIDQIETEKAAELLRAQLLMELEMSERELTEELRRSEEKFRILFNFAGDAIFIHYPDGKLIECNQRAQEYLGYSRDDLLERSFLNLSPGEYAETISNSLANLKKSQNTFYETVHITKDGKTIPVEINSRLFEYQGEYAVLSIARDITERKRAEEEKAELADLLRQAQKMEAIGCLTGGIAHDFNNILQAILGYTHLAMRRLPTDTVAYKHLEKVDQAGQRAAEVVQEMLTFSRHSQKDMRPIHLQPVVKEVMKLLHGSLPSTIEIETHIDPSCPAVMANPTQIHQVLMNLCVNAYHAMRDHGGKLEISLVEVEVKPEMAEDHPDLHPGPHVVLRIRDTGCGMDQATMQRIFEPYFTTKSAGEGTGLGLAMVHGIVKIHGGAVLVDSTVGRGSTFEVLLPVHIAESSPPVVENTEIEAPLGTERILVVDDEQLIVNLAEHSLEEMGYRVNGYRSSMDALDTFRANPSAFDVVVTDQTMPHLTGIELAREISKIRPGIPILLCTGYGESLIGQNIQMSGICEILKKPFDELALARAIRRAMENQEVGRRA
ncbi:MAG TPA: PAS domain S-box protein [bacterium]|nr:PAS domain S-box protein [bacterium]HQL63408.1 PAS domain S-box protein [bacterium]